jgi:hypothetical protein
LLEVYISISQADSGWGDTYTPLAEEQKAMMKGYKMNNGTFGQAYNGTGTKTWTTFDATSNTGSVTVCPTGIAANWVGYKLHYQLKSPVITKISPIELKIPTNGSIHIYSTINPYVNYTHFKNLKAMLMTLISSLSDVSSKLQDNNKKIDDVAFIVPDSANVIMQNSELFTHIGNPDNSNPDILKNIFVPNAGRYKITFEARKALGTAPTTINLMLNSVKYNTSLLGYTIQSFSLPSTQTTFTTFSCTMDVPIPAYDIIAVTASSSSGTTEIRNITLLGVPGDKSEGVFK